MITRKCVLLLEDDEAARHALERILRNAGYDVIARGSAEEAQADADVRVPDIAILDVRLPGRFGDDFGRELAQKHTRVVVFFLTAECVVEHLKECVPGATVLRKPTDVDALLRMLAGGVTASPLG